VLQVLEQKGLARVENGKRALIIDRDEWKLLDPDVLRARVRHDEGHSFLDNLVKVRVALEADMAAGAAVMATTEQLADIGIKIENLRNALGNAEEYFRADSEFHDALMRASGNELGRAIVLNLYHEARAELGVGLENARLEVSNEGHIAIYEALLARDPERAAMAIREHISSTWEPRARLIGW
jgi:DNA-binding FadR family transcriptional regulator